MSLRRLLLGLKVRGIILSISQRSGNGVKYLNLGQFSKIGSCLFLFRGINFE